MNELKKLYEEYLKDYEKARSGKKFGEGILGFGRSMSQDPCHERFAEGLKAYCAERFTEDIKADEAEECLRFMLDYPAEYRNNPQLFWMFMAVQKFALPLTKKLPAETAAKIEEEFSGKYSKWERFEVQEQMLSALRETSGQGRKKRRKP